MDFRDLTVAQIAAWLEQLSSPSRRLLRRLARDPRRGVRRLARRYAAALASAQREFRRVQALYREERRHAGPGRLAAGVDEVGRGPLAGPVVAAAVVLGPGPPIRGLDDSKRLRPEVREALAQEIRARALAVAVAQASVEEIDRWNILGACRLAMRRAVLALAPAPDVLLVDGREPLPGPWPQVLVVGGDATCASIAAASIIAKVTRDHLMVELDRVYPGYGFARHKGYATREHLAALERYGPCPAHRRSFLPHVQLGLFEAPRAGIPSPGTNT